MSAYKLDDNGRPILETPNNAIVDGVDTTTTGVKLSYTVPTGKKAFLRFASWFNNAGTPTVRLELKRGATVIVLRESNASFLESGQLSLLEGDIVQFNVSVAGTTSNADGCISVAEYPA
jgi:hypothetical protein